MQRPKAFAAAALRLYGETTQSPTVKEVFLPAPDTARYSAEVEADDVVVTAVCMQGWRNTMEDTHSIHLNLAPGIHYIAVFDGHGGIETAMIAAETLADCISSSSHFAAGRYADALRDGFVNCDNDICDIQAHSGRYNGSTAVVVLITATHVYCANVGDSRAVLCRGNKAVDLSQDHKPSLKREYDRVVAAGGQIINGRVRGMLAMTRALGDVMFKRPDVSPEAQIVTPVPEVTAIELTDDDFAIVLACDGIWDCITSQEVCQFFLEENNEHDDWALMCENLCEILVAPTLHQFGTDNMTIVTVRFRNRGQNVRMASPHSLVSLGATVNSSISVEIPRLPLGHNLSHTVTLASSPTSPTLLQT
jgi:serine/threonine protein phosphatase PrpC